MGKLNKNLHKAKKEKNDEFYTQLTDIEKEMRHYKKHFKGKVVYCNCDDPVVSNFFHYFSYNFEHLGLKKLISSCYQNQERDLFTQHKTKKAIWLEYNGDKNGNRIPDAEEIGTHYLKGDGDFRSDESIALLKQADIVVTNPPFSLFREYIAQLVKYKKKFLIVGNQNAITYKETFKLLKANKMWLGVGTNLSMVFKSPYKNTNDKNRDYVSNKGLDPDSHIRIPAITWFTNLPHKKRNEKLVLCKKYYGNEGDYPTYDNYNAIEVSKVKNIPMDYAGAMGVPITFMNKYNPKQFEIVTAINGGSKKADMDGNEFYVKENTYLTSIKGKPGYARIIIKNKKVKKDE